MCYAKSTGLGRCSPHAIKRLNRASQEAHTARVLAQRNPGDDAAQQRATDTLKVYFDAMTGFILTPVGLQYVTSVANRQHHSKYVPAVAVRNRAQAADNERRRERRHGREQGADVIKFKRNHGDAADRFTHRDILPTGSSGADCERVCAENMSSASILIAVTTHRHVTNETLKKIADGSTNAHAVSKASAVLRRRQTTRAARTRRDAARRAVAREVAARTTSTLALAA